MRLYLNPDLVEVVKNALENTLFAQELGVVTREEAEKAKVVLKRICMLEIAKGGQKK